MVIFKNLTNVKFQQLKNSIGKDKKRTNLNGVFLDVKNEKLVVTNSKTIFAYDVKVNVAVADHGCDDIIIDPKIFNQDSWLSVPKEDAELVDFWVTEETTQVVLGGEVVAISKNIDHEQPFPINWKSVMELDEKWTSVDVDPVLLKSALSSIPSGCSFPTITLGNKIKITSSRYNEEVDEEVHVVGCTMPISFEESRIYDVSERIGIDSKTDLKSLIGRELSRRVLNSWNDDFVDEDNGEIVSVERNEVILDHGIILTEENIAEIDFMIVKEISVLKQ